MGEETLTHRHKKAKHGNLVRVRFLRKGKLLEINYVSVILLRHFTVVENDTTPKNI
jgi:hypothetical protein